MKCLVLLSLVLLFPMPAWAEEAAPPAPIADDARENAGFLRRIFPQLFREEPEESPEEEPETLTAPDPGSSTGSEYEESDDPFSGIDWWGRGWVVGLKGGATVGLSAAPTAWGTFSFGRTFGLFEMEGEYGIGSSGGSSRVFGHHVGIHGRLYPIGRSVLRGVRLSPYLAGGAQAELDQTDSDDDGDGIWARDSAGTVWGGGGLEAGYADWNSDLVGFIEIGFAYTGTSGEDSADPERERGSAVLLQIGVRIRMFDFLPSMIENKRP